MVTLTKLIIMFMPLRVIFEETGADGQDVDSIIWHISTSLLPYNMGGGGYPHLPENMNNPKVCGFPFKVFLVHLNIFSDT